MKSIEFLLYESFIFIWNNEFDKGIEILNKCNEMISSNETDFEKKNMDDVLILLLSKRQYFSVLNFFKETKNSAMEKFKPIYYALMTYMKDAYPNEILRMGSELEELVNEVIAKVEKWAIDYK